MHIEDATILASLILSPEARYTFPLIDPKLLRDDDARQAWLCLKNHLDVSPEELLAFLARETDLKDFKWMDHGIFQDDMAARAVKDYYQETLRVKLANTLSGLAKKVADREMTVQEALDSAWSFQEKLVTESEAKDLERVANETWDVLELVWSGERKALDWPWLNVEELANGLWGGELVIVAGRPSMGKSAFMMNAGLKWAEKGRKVCLISIEMKAMELLLRMSEREFDFSLSRNVKSFAGDNQSGNRAKLQKTFSRIMRLPMCIVDSGKNNIHEVITTIRNLRVTKGIEVFVVDYLQLMAGKARNRDQEIGEITRALKRVAMELNVPIICGAQLNRETEKNEAAIPSLANLRESGNIEQDADLVMFLYRPWYYGMKKELARKAGNKTDDSVEIRDEKRLDIIVAKQRNGSTGAVTLEYDLNRQTIEDRR